MAKDNAYYFSHDYNAHNDVKILFMRQQLGMEGYGIYWFLIENLADAGGFLPLKIIPVLAMQMHTTEVKVSAVINQFELFELTDNQFFSARLNKHLQIRQHIKTINSEKGKKSAEKRKLTAVKPQLNNGSTKERKGKEIKGKEIKEDKSKEIPPTQNLTFRCIYPTYQDFKELPSQYIESVKMQTQQTKKINLESSTITELWDAFKLQNLDGQKMYQNENDVYRHFVNWFKSQKFENNGTATKSRAQKHSDGIQYLLQRGREEYAKVMAINQQNQANESTIRKDT